MWVGKDTSDTDLKQVKLLAVSGEGTEEKAAMFEQCHRIIEIIE